MSTLHLSPAYEIGVDYEVVNESITNESAWHFARAYELGLDSDAARPYLETIDLLEEARAMVSVASPESIQVASKLVKALRATHSYHAA